MEISPNIFFSNFFFKIMIFYSKLWVVIHIFWAKIACYLENKYTLLPRARTSMPLIFLRKRRCSIIAPKQKFNSAKVRKKHMNPFFLYYNFAHSTLIIKSSIKFDSTKIHKDYMAHNVHLFFTFSFSQNIWGSMFDARPTSFFMVHLDIGSWAQDPYSNWKKHIVKN